MYSATTTNLNPTFPAQKEGYDEAAADTLQNNDEGNYLSGATYLIKNKEYLRELTDDIEQLFAKAKTMLPKEDGVPLEEDSEKKKVKTNDETASTEANNYQSTQTLPLVTHATRKQIGLKKKSTGPNSETKKPLKDDAMENRPSAKKVKCNEKIPVTTKATMDSNRDYSDTTPPRSADTKPIPCSKTEAHSQTSPVQCWVCMFIKSIPLINIIIMILVTSNRESNIEFLIQVDTYKRT